MIRCLGCGVSRVRRIEPTVQDAVAAILCEECGLVQLPSNGPRPLDKVAALERIESRAQNVRRKENAARAVAMALKVCGTDCLSLFEMGVVDGEVLRAATELGLDAVGGSTSEGIVAAAKYLSMPVYSLELLPNDLFSSFDIALSLDHLTASATPRGDLDVILRLLRPGGVLVLRSLVCDDPAVAATSAAVGHCSLFTVATLKGMLISAGFDVEQLTLGQRVTVIARRPLRTVQCSKCNSSYIPPRLPEEILCEGYLSSRRVAAELFEEKRTRPESLKAQRRILEKSIAVLGRPAKTLFDFGCGAGAMLFAAREQGIVAEGSDSSAYWIDYLKSNGFNVHLSSIDGFFFPERAIDIAIVLNELEYCFDPSVAVKDIYKSMVSGSVLYLTAQCLDCPGYREMMSSWNMYGVGHIRFFSFDKICSIIEEGGFRLVEAVEGSQSTFIARKL